MSENQKTKDQTTAQAVDLQTRVRCGLGHSLRGQLIFCDGKTMDEKNRKVYKDFPDCKYPHRNGYVPITFEDFLSI